ncbi:MAG: hypothetical protein WC523_04635 [Patescibacteria group bacterium]
MMIKGSYISFKTAYNSFLVKKVKIKSVGGVLFFKDKAFPTWTENRCEDSCARWWAEHAINQE